MTIFGNKDLRSGTTQDEDAGCAPSSLKILVGGSFFFWSHPAWNLNPKGLHPMICTACSIFFHVWNFQYITIDYRCFGLILQWTIYEFNWQPCFQTFKEGPNRSDSSAYIYILIYLFPKKILWYITFQKLVLVVSYSKTARTRKLLGVLGSIARNTRRPCTLNGWVPFHPHRSSWPAPRLLDGQLFSQRGKILGNHQM